MATAVSRPKRKARYTEQELLGLPDDGRKYELVHGRLREVPTGARHGWIGFRLAGRLYAVDIAVMHRHRLPEGLPPEAFVEGAPELAIEIVSPSERQSELLEKIAEYFDSGAQEVWLLLPERKQVYRYRAPLEVEILNAEDMLTGGDLLPQFRLRVGELFE
jgi:hypothetical protein